DLDRIFVAVAGVDQALVDPGHFFAVARFDQPRERPQQARPNRNRTIGLVVDHDVDAAARPALETLDHLVFLAAERRPRDETDDDHSAHAAHRGDQHRRRQTQLPEDVHQIFTLVILFMSTNPSVHMKMPMPSTMWPRSVVNSGMMYGRLPTIRNS